MAGKVSDALTITMKNEAKIAKAWANFPADMSREIANGLRAAAVFLTGKVKEVIASGESMWKAPLDTGAMRRGIHPVFESFRAIIRPSAATPYADFVHEGTRFLQARPFFDITKERYTEEAMKFVEERIDNAVDKIIIQ